MDFMKTLIMINYHLIGSLEEFLYLIHIHLVQIKGYLRLFLKPQFFSSGQRYNVLGFTQKESDFELEAKMKFKPKKHLEEAGISVYQKDLNYVSLTVQKIGKQDYIKLSVNEKRDSNPSLSSSNIEVI